MRGGRGRGRGGRAWSWGLQDPPRLTERETKRGARLPDRRARRQPWPGSSRNRGAGRTGRVNTRARGLRGGSNSDSTLACSYDRCLSGLPDAPFPAQLSVEVPRPGPLPDSPRSAPHRPGEQRSQRGRTHGEPLCRLHGCQHLGAARATAGRRLASGTIGGAAPRPEISLRD